MRMWSRVPTFCFVSVLAGAVCQSSFGQDPNIKVDPNTGMRYRRQFRTVQKPVTETKLESKVVTISRPEVVTEAEPVVTTYYSPVVRHSWQPRWKGLWNPFTPPTLAYEFVPQTNWEARSETTHRLKTSTRWVAEQKVVQEPKLVTAIQQDQEEYWVAIGPDPNYVPSGYGAPGIPASARTQVAALPAPSAGMRNLQPTRPEISGGMAPTVLDPYSTRSYSTTPIFR